MATAKKATKKASTGGRIGVARTDAEHMAIQAFIGRVDELAVTMERKWGVDRLPRLVAPEWATKFYAQAKKMADAARDGSVADVQVESERMISAWTYLDQLAVASGAPVIPDDQWWEVSLGDGQVVAFCRHWDEGRAVLASGRKVVVYTPAEIARLAQAHPTVATIKKAFEGAEVVDVRLPVRDPMINWSVGDDLALGAD